MYEIIQATHLVDRPRLTFSETWDEELQKADLLMRMALVQKTPGRPREEKRMSRYKFVARADVEVLREIFGQVPESVHACMAKWQAFGLRQDQARVPVASALYEILSRIRFDQKRSKSALRTPAISAVPTPAKYALRTRAKNALRTRAKNALRTRAKRPPEGFVSKKRLMNEIGLHPTAIDYLINIGLIKDVVKVESTSVYTASYLIPETEYQALLALHKETMSIQEAAEFAIVRPSTIRILGYSGAIQILRLGKCKHVFRLNATDMAAVMQCVRSRARRFLGPVDSLVALEDALTELYRFELRLPKLLLEEIQTGRVQVLVLIRSALHLGECYLDSGVYLEWCRKSKPAGARRVNKIPG